jgi:hypothetical protein
LLFFNCVLLGFLAKFLLGLALEEVLVAKRTIVTFLSRFGQE